MIQKNFRRSFKVIILAEGEGFELKIPRCGFALQNGGSQVETHSHRKRESDDSLFLWLGMRDSNPRMSAPKADALPLGESPV
jgi:hypothetical protein